MSVAIDTKIAWLYNSYSINIIKQYIIVEEGGGYLANIHLCNNDCLTLSS